LPWNEAEQRNLWKIIETMKNRPRICFISNDSSFFLRHFGPAIAAALSKGFRISAFLPADGRVFDERDYLHITYSPIDRFSYSFLDLIHQAVWLIRHIWRERPEVVVAFSLRVCLALALALPFVRVPRVVFSITGLGLLVIMKDHRSRILRSVTYAAMRIASLRKNCYFIFENPWDAKTMGFRSGQPVHQRLFVGAGVDVSEFVPVAFPPPVPFKLATVSRLVWSKGVDLAVQAVSELSREGFPAVLNIYGAPDGTNPQSVDPNVWKGESGVAYRGYTDDIAGVWAQHHAGIFPSRGGEGLPRSLLEAAACGRPCIVTDVPGCADFIRDGVDGYVAKANSVASLKVAIRKLMGSPESLSGLGQSARERVLKTSTVQLIQKQYEELFDLSRR
jgi:glycosyltransferase involved in cell wall biosynthesis